MSSSPISRRTLLHTGVLGAVAASMQQRIHAAEKAAGPELKGRIRHSVCKWCYPKISLDELCIAAKSMGISSIELLDPPDLATVKKHGLECAIVSYPTIEGPDGVKVGKIEHGLNNPAYHDLLAKAYEPWLKAAAEGGADKVICFSGNRNGMDDEVGMKNCAEGLKKLIPLAEKYNITLVMELLNSRVNHRDYMCDKSAWGVELCKLVGSERFKLLYDIYHMQIMEGDIIATIRRDHQYFAHYHTGGVPGRNEINDSQELHYPAIMKAIVETGYKGFVGQEFIPKAEDKMASLKEAVLICDI